MENKKEKVSVGIITFEEAENREEDSVASSRIRGRWLAKYWPEAELYNPGRKYDVLIFQKAYWRPMLEMFEGIKIFDICDPDWHHGRPVVQTINYCDAVVSSTEILTKDLKRMTKKPVVTIPDRVDLEFYPQFKKHKGKAQRAVWFGYSTNFGQLEYVVQALHRVGMTLTVIADKELSVADEFRRWSLETFNDDFTDHDICVLPDNSLYDPIFRYKSNNKTITSWLLGLPVAKTMEEIDKFMEAEARNKEVLERLQQVKENYDVKKSVEEYRKLIDDLCKKKLQAKRK